MLSPIPSRRMGTETLQLLPTDMETRVHDCGKQGVLSPSVLSLKGGVTIEGCPGLRSSAQFRLAFSEGLHARMARPAEVVDAEDG